MKIKGVTIAGYKGALRSAESYRKQVDKGKILQSNVMENFLTDVKPYLTKKGELRKNLSKKKYEEFNKLVKGFKESPYSSVKKLKEITHKADVTYTETHAGATMAEAQTVRELFVMANDNKIKLGSDIVEALADDAENNYKISTDDYKKILEEYLNRKATYTPEEAQDYLAQDDTVEVMQRLMTVFNGLGRNKELQSVFYTMISDNTPIKDIEQLNAIYEEIKDNKTKLEKFIKLVNVDANPKTIRKHFPSIKKGQAPIKASFHGVLY